MITEYQKNVITTMLSQMVPGNYRFAVLIIPVTGLNPPNASTVALDNCGKEPLQRRQLAQVLRNTAKTFDPHGS